MATLHTRVDDLDNSIILSDDNPSTLLVIDDPRLNTEDGTPLRVRLDLSDKSLDALRKGTLKFIQAGTPVGPPVAAQSKPGTRTTVDRERTKTIRAWAMADDRFDVSERGALPREVIEAYATEVEGADVDATAQAS